MTQYDDDDLVYINLKTKEVLGKVEWLKDGQVKPLEMQEVVEPTDEGAPPKKYRGKPRKRYYPWGSYRSMKKLYHVEGKSKEIDHYKTFDDALEKSLKEPFWD